MFRDFNEVVSDIKKHVKYSEELTEKEDTARRYKDLTAELFKKAMKLDFTLYSSVRLQVMGSIKIVFSGIRSNRKLDLYSIGKERDVDQYLRLLHNLEEVIQSLYRRRNRYEDYTSDYKVIMHLVDKLSEINKEVINTCVVNSEFIKVADILGPVMKSSGDK